MTESRRPWRIQEGFLQWASLRALMGLSFRAAQRLFKVADILQGPARSICSQAARLVVREHSHVVLLEHPIRSPLVGLPNTAKAILRAFRQCAWHLRQQGLVMIIRVTSCATSNRNIVKLCTNLFR